jgi:3-oxoacyl-(acyl-carrier-protein) synthase
MASFSSLGLLASYNGDPTKACRPYSLDRSGIVLSEGAAVVILEELDRVLQSGRRIYGEVLGYGESFDSYHTHQPLPSAEYCAKAIRNALTDASVQSDEVDYINPHGSASVLNDKAETMAIKKVFGRHAYELSASSTKSMIGHTLGACGALELVACALMLDRQYLHPTINLDIQDPDCDLDFIPNVGRAQSTKRILSISSGFGGYNAACLIGKVE